MSDYWKEIPGEMFDFENFYQRIANEMPNGARIAEVGVADGKSAIFLAEAMARQGKTFHMHMIDNLDYGHTGQLTEIIHNIQKSGLGEHITFLPLDSLAASCKFNDEYFHFVFIDASHKYEETKADIRLWFRKIAPGYLLAGHDYNTGPEGINVYKAVTEVIPQEHLQSQETERGYGVWFIRNNNGSHVK
jgi:predicted O-methyltransferase YrrM